MRPFLEIRRHEVVDLASPWDPARIVGEYLEYRREESAAPSAEDLAALDQGGVLRFDLEHRRLGTVEAELHVNVVEPTRVRMELAAVLSLRWWLRPLAWPFRPRLRRWINTRVDQMLEELAQDAPATDGPVQDPSADETPSNSRPSANVSWTLRILTPSGKSVYQHTDGAH